MTAMAADVTMKGPCRAATRDRMEFYSSWAIGATGAVGTQVTDDAGIVLTRTGVGTYTITYPAGQAAFFDFELLAVDATPTAASFCLTAKSPTAGTATIVALNGTAAAEIESGSTLTVIIAVFSRVAPGGG